MYDTRAVRQALRALGEEPAPVPVDDVRRVVLAGGGNEIAMSLYRAMGRGTKELSEPQMRQRQLEMLEQFEREAQQVLKLLGAFRTVISLEDERAARRGLPQPEEVTVVATGTGTMHHAALGAEAVPVQPGATYRLRGHPVLASEADVGAEEPVVGRWEGTSASKVVDSRVQRLRRERVAPDMETCDDCKGTVAWIPDRQQFVHTDSDLVAYSKDGHIIHAERLQRIVDAERVRDMDAPVQQGPAMDTEEEAKAIVRRAMEAARADIDAYRTRTARYDRDSGIEPGIADTFEFEGPRPQPNSEESVLGRVRHGLARARKWLDGYTARELDELEEQQRSRRGP